MTGTINRTLIAVFTAVVLTVSIAAQAQPAAAAQLTPLDYESTGLDGHPELSSGGVLDITLGRSIGANEVHRVVGAAPSTNYTVSADIFFATPCQNDDPFGPVTLEEGTLSTNPRSSPTSPATRSTPPRPSSGSAGTCSPMAKPHTPPPAPVSCSEPDRLR
jgi:hypothetical protein